MKICILSQQHFSNKHVSEGTVDAFETAFMQYQANDCIKVPLSEFIFKVNRKIAIKLHSGGSGILTDKAVIRKVNESNPDFVFIIAMSPGTLAYQVKTLKKINHKKIVYCIDTWTQRVDQWKSLLKEAGVDCVFCSYKASVKVFREFIKDVYYLPQSMNEKYFYPRNTGEKTHLFMQMGRKNQTLHEWVLRYIAEHGLADSDYIREKEKGQIIYPEFEQLAEEINKTSFFILAPRDVEEPQITGAISDVTARFYEGMACKTLLVGFKPKDTFDELFPSATAMIEVKDYDDFKNKIDFYRQNNDVYNEIVENNYDYLMRHHTWSHRVITLIEKLSDNQKTN